MTAVSTTLRTRRVALCAHRRGRAGSSSVAGRPSFTDEPMLPAATAAFRFPRVLAVREHDLESAADHGVNRQTEAGHACAEVDDAVGVRGRLHEPVGILEVAATNLRRRAPTTARRKTWPDPGQAGDLRPGGDELWMMYEPEGPVPPVRKRA